MTDNVKNKIAGTGGQSHRRFWEFVFVAVLVLYPLRHIAWGLDLWEQWCGLPTDRSRPYSYRRGRIKAKLRGQGATTAEMIASVVASFGFQPEQVSVTEHPADYQFEVVVSDLAAVPEDTADIQAAVNEIKPAHLDWWFTWVMAQLLETVGIGSGLWRVRETAIPPMEE